MFGPEVWPYDVLRVIAMALAVVVIFTTALIATDGRFPRNQVMRSIGAALLGFAIIGRYLSGLGTLPYPAWVLVTVVIGVTLLAVGNVQLVARRT